MMLAMVLLGNLHRPVHLQCGPPTCLQVGLQIAGGVNQMTMIQEGISWYLMWCQLRLLESASFALGSRALLMNLRMHFLKT